MQYKIYSSHLKCNQTISSTTIHHIKTGQYDLLCKTEECQKTKCTIYYKVKSTQLAIHNNIQEHLPQNMTAHKHTETLHTNKTLKTTQVSLAKQVPPAQSTLHLTHCHRDISKLTHRSFLTSQTRTSRMEV